MFWVRRAALFVLVGFLGIWAGAFLVELDEYLSRPALAQTGCVPNPNLNGPPFVDGCPLMASGLNHLAPPIKQNAASFVPIGLSGSVTNANTYVLGSASSPDTTQNPIMAIEKFAASPAPSGADQALYVAGLKTTNVSDTRLTGELIQVQDQLGWSGIGGGLAFIEGLRTQAGLATTSVHGSAYGTVTLAMEQPGSSHVYLIGIESEVINRTFDGPTAFNPATYSASYVATTGRGNKITDAAFIVNPYLAAAAAGAPYRRGFYVPAAADPGVPTTVQDTAFAAECACIKGIDLSLMPTTTPSMIVLPNAAPALVFKNAAFTQNVQVLKFDAASAVDFGYDANIAAVNIGNATTPTNILGGLQLKKVAVSALPSCTSGIEGQLYSVTDANSAVFNAAVVGGGGNHVMAYCNGTGWTVH